MKCGILRDKTNTASVGFKSQKQAAGWFTRVAEAARKQWL
jgi:hypothetical protein